VRKDRLRELADWVRNGSGTDDYDGPRQFYRLRFDWKTVQSVDDQFEVVSAAVERCFGSRGGPGWTLWVTGAQLGLLASYNRTEYLKLQEAEASQLALLDLWVDDILLQLKHV
jgi:hypothetical protein